MQPLINRSFQKQSSQGKNRSENNEKYYIAYRSWPNNPSYRFSHEVDRIGKRQKWIDLLEKLWKQNDRVCSPGTGYLQDEQHNCRCFSDIPKDGDDSIDN